MKTRILVTSLLFVFSLCKAAEPTDSYLKDSVLDMIGLWFVSPYEIEGRTITPPQGGYILRIKYDLDGDGIDDVLLSDSSLISKATTNWTVYRGKPANKFIKIGSDAGALSTLWVRTEGSIKKYSRLIPQTAKETESIYSFWIDAAGKFQESDQSVTLEQSYAIGRGGDPALLEADGLPNDDKVARYLGMGMRVTLSMEKVLLGKLYQNPNAPWRAVSSDCSLGQQYLDPADATDIASLATWTPPNDH